MVVLAKPEYIRKAEDLLGQSDMLAADPTHKQKSKLINLLRTLNTEGGLGDNIYKRMYPTGAGPPSYMGNPKSIQRTPP